MRQASEKKIKITIRLTTIFSVSVFAFGIGYWILGFKSGSGVYSKDIAATLIECIYFSLVSITTLGYGDLVPLGLARGVAATEAVFGLLFAGYSISQIVSFRQEALTEYIVNNLLFQTYNECVAEITDAKELIGDRRRAIQQNVPIDNIEFIYNRSNPFYPALKAIQMLNGYTAHVAEIGRASDLEAHVERASHHVEELASFSRKYLNLLESKKADWDTHRTKLILTQLCDSIESFSENYIRYTKYHDQSYKGAGAYTDIVKGIITSIRVKM